MAVLPHGPKQGRLSGTRGIGVGWFRSSYWMPPDSTAVQQLDTRFFPKLPTHARELGKGPPDARVATVV